MIADRQYEWEQEFFRNDEGEYKERVTEQEQIQLRALHLLAVIADQLNALIRDDY